MASAGGGNSSNRIGGGSSGGSSGTKDPWAWLGLLKWSLAYSDGTNNNGSVNKMSDEDRAFLEAVMKEGIIDENERMKVILQQVTDIMSTWKEKQQQQQQQQQQQNEAPAAHAAEFDDFDADQVDHVQDLLQELRDIVEQIDYARAFCALGGLEFLLGTLRSLHQHDDDNDDSTSRPSIIIIPYSIVELCAGILATLSTNNPPVQAQLLELGSIRILTNSYFACCDSIMLSTFNDSDSNNKAHKTIRRLQSRILQAMSANVRSHAVAEQVFCETAQAVPLLEHCLGVTNSTLQQEPPPPPPPPLELQQRGLFFLRALVTSDSSTSERIQRFGPCIATVMDRFVLLDSGDNNCSDSQQGDDAFVQLREATMAMIQQLLEAANSSNDSPTSLSCPPILWSRKDALVSRGVQRVPILRAVLFSTAKNSDVDDDEYTRAQYQSELDQWEAILVLLARATPPPGPATSNETTNPLMIAAAAPETTPSP